MTPLMSYTTLHKTAGKSDYNSCRGDIFACFRTRTGRGLHMYVYDNERGIILSFVFCFFKTKKNVFEYDKRTVIRGEE